MSDFSNRTDMRNWLFAVLMTALLPLVFACDTPREDDTRFDDPVYLAFAGRLTPNAALTKAGDQASAPGDIVTIELTESGLYVIGRATEEEGQTAYTAGTYRTDGSTYTLNGFGKLSFDNSRPGNVSLTVIGNDGSSQTLPATLTKAKDTNMAYRAWVVEKTRVTTKSWSTVSAEFNGCNFKEIAAFLKANSHKVPDEVPDQSIRTISFTGTESVIFIYDDNTVDLGSFSLNGNVFSYGWTSNKWGPKSFTFESDKAIIEYLDGKCVLTINGKIRNSSTSGSVTFLMSPYNP